MKKSHRFHPVRLLRVVNSISGIGALFSLCAMFVAIMMQRREHFYYVSGSTFLFFGLIFTVTAVLFMLRSLMWHIETKRVRYLLRHYLYAFVIIFVALIILDHITVGDDFGWDKILVYTPILSLGSMYLSGYRLRIRRKSPVKIVTEYEAKS